MLLKNSLSNKQTKPGRCVYLIKDIIYLRFCIVFISFIELVLLMSSTNSPEENNKGSSNDVDETKEPKSIHNSQVSDRIKEEEVDNSSSMVPAEE